VESISLHCHDWLLSGYFGPVSPYNSRTFIDHALTGCIEIHNFLGGQSAAPKGDIVQAAGKKTSA
jgi:hypothetical protein